MRETIISKLTKTKWGWRIYLDDQPAFLSYSGDYRDFNAETEYTCQIHYRLSYAKAPDAANKQWSELRGDTIEEICENPIFSEFGLKKEQIHPYFRII